MTPIEFALWLNGAADVIGDEPPSKEQWERIHEKLNACIGKLVAHKLLEEAEEAAKRREDQRKKEEAAAQIAAYHAQAKIQAQTRRLMSQRINEINELALGDDRMTLTFDQNPKPR